MAKCPQCGKYFDDALSFCLEDGSYLVADRQAVTEMPTADYRNTPTLNKFENGTFRNPSVPTISHSSSTGPAVSTVIIVVFLIISGFVLLGAAGVAGFMFYAASGNSHANITSNPPPGGRSPTPLDTLGETTATRDDPTYPDNKVKDVRRDVPDGTLGSDKKIPKQISAGVLNGKALHLPKPIYPAAARAVRASGSVNVQVLIDESGTVVTASAVNGHPLLRLSAVQAARSAKFEPTKLSGQAVKVTGVITYNFVAP